MLVYGWDSGANGENGLENETAVGSTKERSWRKTRGSINGGEHAGGLIDEETRLVGIDDRWFESRSLGNLKL